MTEHVMKNGRLREIVRYKMDPYFQIILSLGEKTNTFEAQPSLSKYPAVSVMHFHNYQCGETSTKSKRASISVAQYCVIRRACTCSTPNSPRTANSAFSSLIPPFLLLFRRQAGEEFQTR